MKMSTAAVLRALAMLPGTLALTLSAVSKVTPMQQGLAYDDSASFATAAATEPWSMLEFSSKPAVLRTNVSGAVKLLDGWMEASTDASLSLMLVSGGSGLAPDVRTACGDEPPKQAYVWMVVISILILFATVFVGAMCFNKPEPPAGENTLLDTSPMPLENACALHWGNVASFCCAVNNNIVLPGSVQDFGEVGGSLGGAGLRIGLWGAGAIFSLPLFLMFPVHKCSMALKMMDGKTVRPQKMVTHNWSNLFRDLVACIVSDALNESTFGLVADLLDFDMPALERMLDAKALKKSYWVCAFSVNQHQSICAHNPARTVDPKTGVEHPVCSCGATVYFNNTPPLREIDSKSIHCQMNKFDDMMSFLSAADSNFSQVIAVDRAFGLFNRAWCVAELAAADNMGMRQHLKLASHEAMHDEEATRHLKALNVEQMQAARAEDVQEILAKIHDIPAFNAHLQELLFGEQGLFDRWQNFDVLEQEAEVGRLALFADTLARRAMFATSISSRLGDDKSPSSNNVSEATPVRIGRGHAEDETKVASAV
mmetsp:Transcript_91393/g.261625  ORF Transcript_91393/g.261625 Transcript_91393/m.261625 type:complete len:540 (+) Transcript_91393:69-1688(+)